MWGMIAKLLAKIPWGQVLKAAVLAEVTKSIVQGLESIVRSLKNIASGEATPVAPETYRRIADKVMEVQTNGGAAEEAADIATTMLSDALADSMPEEKTVIVPLWYSRLSAILMQAAAEQETRLERLTRFISWFQPQIKFFLEWSNETEEVLEVIRNVMDVTAEAKSDKLPVTYYNPWELFTELQTKMNEQHTWVFKSAIPIAVEVSTLMDQGNKAVGTEMLMAFMYREFRRARILVGKAHDVNLDSNGRFELERTPVPLPYSVLEAPLTMYHEPFDKEVHRALSGNIVSSFPFHQVKEIDGAEIMMHQTWLETNDASFKPTALANLEDGHPARIEGSVMGMSPIVIAPRGASAETTGKLYINSDVIRSAIKDDLLRRRKI